MRPFSFKNLEKKIIPSLFLGFLVFLTLSFWGDFSKTLKTLFSIPLSLFFLALFLSCLNYILRFFRWQIFLKQILGSKYQIAVKDSFLIFLSGLSMAITPFRSGELLKSYLLKRKVKAPISQTAPIFFAERLCDAFSFLFLMTGGLLVYRFGGFVFISSILITSSITIIIQNKKLCLFLISKLKNFPFISSYLAKINNLYESVYKLTKLKNILIGSVIGFFAWGVQVLGSYFFINYFLNSELLITNYKLLLTTAFIAAFSTAVGFTIPLPGGIGASEPTTTGLLIFLLQFSREKAVATTILARMSTLWFGTLVGIAALFFALKSKPNPGSQS